MLGASQNQDILPIACEYVIGKVLKLGAKSHMT
jgi:hypothetical protein